MRNITSVGRRQGRSALRRRPRLERLESRLALSTIGFSAASGTLTILGTNAGESVTVYDDGAGRVGVDLDNNGGVADFETDVDVFAVDRIFTGVKKVKIDMRDGNDDVLYLFTAGLATNRTLDITMGRGSDELDVNGTELRTLPAGDYLYMTGDMTADLKITARAGNAAGSDVFGAVDDLYISIGGGDNFALDGDVNIAVKGGAGADNATVFVFAEEMTAASAVSVDMDGGNGNDILTAEVGSFNYEGEGGLDGEGVELGASIKIDVDGDAGNDDLSGRVTVYDTTGVESGVDITGEIDVDVDGGSGNDVIEAIVDAYSNLSDADIEAEANIRIDADGNAGNDDIFALVSIESAAAGDNELEGTVNVDVDGDAGNDILDAEVIVAGGAEGDNSIEGEVNVVAKGDAGIDDLSALVDLFGGGVAAGAVIDVTVDGDAGNDFGHALVILDGYGVGLIEGVVNVRVEGDAGNDDICAGLAVLAADVAPGAVLDVEVDGGSGIDRVAAELLFEGLFDGWFDLEMDGGTGNDLVIADVTLLGGAEGGDLGGGVVDIEGDTGNDVVSYRQDDATGNVSAVLDGDPGFDIAHVLAVSGNLPTLKSFNAVDAAVLDPDCLPDFDDGNGG